MIETSAEEKSMADALLRCMGASEALVDKAMDQAKKKRKELVEQSSQKKKSSTTGVDTLTL